MEQIGMHFELPEIQCYGPKHGIQLASIPDSDQASINASDQRFNGVDMDALRIPKILFQEIQMMRP
jgi:hypothetical protein